MQANGPQGPDAQRQAKAMHAVVAYVERYPDAADSEAGIFEWWLAEMEVEVALPDLRAALAELVAAGRLKLTQLADGTVIYGAGPAR